MRLFTLLLIFPLSYLLAANEVVFSDELTKKNGKYILESTGELFSGTSIELRGDLKGKDSNPKRLVTDIKDGQPTQYSLWHMRTNTKIHEINFKNGQRHGILTMRRIDGSLQHQGTWKEGKRNGSMTSYYPNGEVSFQGMRKDGKVVGVDKCYEKGGFSSTCTSAKRSGDFSLTDPDSIRKVKEYLVKKAKQPAWSKAEKLLDFTVDKEHYLGRSKRSNNFVNCDESIFSRDFRGTYLNVGDNKIDLSKRENMKGYSPDSYVCTNDEVIAISTNNFNEGRIGITKYKLVGDHAGDFIYNISRGYPRKPVVYFKESETDYIVGIQEWGGGITETDYYFRLPKKPELNK